MAEVPNDRIEQIRQVLVKYVFSPPTLVGAPIFPKELLDKMVSNDTIRSRYVKVFTHISASSGKPRQGSGRVLITEDNYEKTEFVGDMFANFIVADQILDRRPNLLLKEITNLTSHYKSNYVYGSALQQSIPNIGDIILKSPTYELTMKNYADVFESLIYAIIKAGNDIMPGWGYACAANAFALLTRSVVLEDKYRYGHPKNYINEVLGSNSTQQSVETKGDKITATVYITQDGKERIQRYLGIRARDVQSSYSDTANDKEIAVWNAHQKLLEKLESYGFLGKARENEIFQGFGPIGDDAKKLAAANEETLEFSKKSTEEGQKEWTLIAVKNATNERYWIASVVGSSSSAMFHESKKRLLEEYVKQGYAK